MFDLEGMLYIISPLHTQYQLWTNSIMFYVIFINILSRMEVVTILDENSSFVSWVILDWDIRVTIGVEITNVIEERNS
jgi:hypothetical protein